MLLIIIYGISKHFGPSSRIKHAVVCIRVSELYSLLNCLHALDNGWGCYCQGNWLTHGCDSHHRLGHSHHSNGQSQGSNDKFFTTCDSISQRTRTVLPQQLTQQDVSQEFYKNIWSEGDTFNVYSSSLSQLLEIISSNITLILWRSQWSTDASRWRYATTLFLIFLQLYCTSGFCIYAAVTAR